MWGKILIFSGLGSISYAAFVAIKQDSLKRLLAYSSVGHVGFIVLALSMHSLEGMQALFFYSLIYMITSIPTWGLVLSCFEGKQKSQNNIILLAGLATSSPLLTFIGAIAFFSLAGIPPLVGFYSNFYFKN
jgi:NADH-quinone oxidoreductase subunit N